MRKDHAWARWGLRMLAEELVHSRERLTLLLLATVGLGLGRSLAGSLLLRHGVGRCAGVGR